MKKLTYTCPLHTITIKFPHLIFCLPLTFSSTPSKKMSFTNLTIFVSSLLKIFPSHLYLFLLFRLLLKVLVYVLILCLISSIPYHLSYVIGHTHPVYYISIYCPSFRSVYNFRPYPYHHDNNLHLL